MSSVFKLYCTIGNENDLYLNIPEDTDLAEFREEILSVLKKLKDAKGAKALDDRQVASALVAAGFELTDMEYSVFDYDDPDTWND